jgi:hypothetical protein
LLTLKFHFFGNFRRIHPPPSSKRFLICSGIIEHEHFFVFAKFKVHNTFSVLKTELLLLSRIKSTFQKSWQYFFTFEEWTSSFISHKVYFSKKLTILFHFWNYPLEFFLTFQKVVNTFWLLKVAILSKLSHKVYIFINFVNIFLKSTNFFLRELSKKSRCVSARTRAETWPCLLGNHPSSQMSPHLLWTLFSKSLLGGDMSTFPKLTPPPPYKFRSLFQIF